MLTVGIKHPAFPCERFDGRATVNGVELTLANDGTTPQGWHYFMPQPGCSSPWFESRDEVPSDAPFELRIERGDEVVTLRSETLLTLDFTGPAEVQRGGELRLSPNDPATPSAHAWFEVEGEAVALLDEDDATVRHQKLQLRLWDTHLEGDVFVASVPVDMPLGTYTWSAKHLINSIHPFEACEGAAACEVSLSADSQGEVTVR